MARALDMSMPQRSPWQGRPIRVVVADAHAVFRGVLVKLLQADPQHLTVVGEAATFAQLLEQVAATQPDVALLDVRLPVLESVVVARILRRQFPRACVLALSLAPTKDWAPALREAGATLCIDKADPSVVLAAFRTWLGQQRPGAPNRVSTN